MICNESSFHSPETIPIELDQCLGEALAVCPQNLVVEGALCLADNLILVDGSHLVAVDNLHYILPFVGCTQWGLDHTPGFGVVQSILVAKYAKLEIISKVMNDDHKL